MVNGSGLCLVFVCHRLLFTAVYLAPLMFVPKDGTLFKCCDKGCVSLVQALASLQLRTWIPPKVYVGTSSLAFSQKSSLHVKHKNIVRGAAAGQGIRDRVQCKGWSLLCRSAFNLFRILSFSASVCGCWSVHPTCNVSDSVQCGCVPISRSLCRGPIR